MKLNIVLLYLLFFMGSVVFFLFVLFPQKQVAAYLSRSLTTENSVLSVKIESIQPALPFGLKSKNIRLLLDQKVTLTPEYVKVFLKPVSMFKKENHIQFQSGLSRGFIEGSLLVNSLDPFLFSQLKLVADRVKISNFRYKSNLADIVLNAELNGEFKQEEDSDKAESAHGDFFIQNLTAEMKNSLFNTLNLPVVDFSDIKLEFTQSRKTIKVKQCMARGSIIHVTCKGNIDIFFPLEKSKLTLTGVILPDSPYLAKFANMTGIKKTVKNISFSGINFNISGTLGNPKIGL